MPLVPLVTVIPLAVNPVTASEKFRVKVIGELLLEVPVGETVTIGPFPVRAMSNGFFSLATLLAIWIAAVFAPTVVGVKVTLKVVLFPGVTVVSIPVVSTVKSPAFVPSLVIVPRVRLAAPVLVIVNVLLVFL